MHLANPGKVRDAIEGYKSGQLQAITGPTVNTHHGMVDSGMGIGGGMGMGRGVGRSKGLDIGKGSGVFEQELEGRIELLRMFLATWDFRELRRESEKLLVEGKTVRFVLYPEKGKLRYEMKAEQ